MTRRDLLPPPPPPPPGHLLSLLITSLVPDGEGYYLYERARVGCLYPINIRGRSAWDFIAKLISTDNVMTTNAGSGRQLMNCHDN